MTRVVRNACIVVCVTSSFSFINCGQITAQNDEQTSEPVVAEVTDAGEIDVEMTGTHVGRWLVPHTLAEIPVVPTADAGVCDKVVPGKGKGHCRHEPREHGK